MSEVAAPAEMSWQRRAALWGIQIAVSAAVLAAGVVGFKALGARKRPPRKATAEAAAARVLTRTIARHEGPIDLVVSGTVHPWRELRLPAEVAGKLVHKSDACRPGRWVAKGDVLFRVEDADYALAATVASERVTQARRALDEQAVEQANLESIVELNLEDLEIRKREVARQQDLKKRKVVADAALEQAQQREVAARAALQATRNRLRASSAGRLRLEAALRMAETELERAKLDLTRTEVKAPIAGRVVRVAAEVGSFVNRGQELIALEDTSRAEVRCTLRMDDLRLVWAQGKVSPVSGAGSGSGREWSTDVPATPAEVRVDVAGRSYVWDGVLERLDGDGIDVRTRMVPAVIRVDAPATPRGPAPRPPLLRGLFVSVHLKVRTARPLLAIPAGALRPGGSVWLVDDGVLRIVRVDLVRRSERVAYVSPKGKLVAGARLVVSPLGAPVDGMRVQEVTE